MLFFVFFVLCIFFDVKEAAILSSSKIELCNDDGDNVSCSNKLVVLVSLENDQKATESLEAVLTAAEGPDGSPIDLQTPIRIILQKSQTLLKYPLLYVQDVNSKPKELIKWTGYFRCADDVKTNVEEHLTCGIQKDNGVYIKDSEGFCCPCYMSEVLGSHHRGNVDCSNFLNGIGASAHCLRFDSLWYGTYEVHPPYIDYVVGIQLEKATNSTSAEYTNLYLSPSQPIKVDSEGLIKARIIGSFALSKTPYNFESKYLVTPMSPYNHERVAGNGHLKNGMLIDRSKFALSGDECRKIGVSYTPFKFESDRCKKLAGSCITNQPDDYWEEDQEKLRNNKTGSYVLSRWGGLHAIEETSTVDRNQKRVLLAYEVTQMQASLIRIEIQANSVNFTTNIATGVIVAASVNTFEAQKDVGSMQATVLNTGKLLADFILTVQNCTLGVQIFDSGRYLSIEPNATLEAEFPVTVEAGEAALYECMIVLQNAEGSVIDKVQVGFSVTELKPDLGGQGGNSTGDNDIDYGFEGPASCKTVCGFFNIFCHFWYKCWQQLLTTLSVLVAILAVVILIIFFRRQIALLFKKVFKGKTLKDQQNGRESEQTNLDEGGSTPKSSVSHKQRHGKVKQTYDAVLPDSPTKGKKKGCEEPNVLNIRVSYNPDSANYPNVGVCSQK